MFVGTGSLFAVSEIKFNEFLFSYFLTTKIWLSHPTHDCHFSSITKLKRKSAVHHFKNVFQELCQISCDLYAWSGCHWMHLYIILVLSSQLLKTTKKLMHEKDTDSAKFKIHRQCFVKGNFLNKISSNCFVFAKVVNFRWKKHILHCKIRFSIYSQKIYC